MDRTGISNRETPDEEQHERETFQPLEEQAGSNTPQKTQRPGSDTDEGEPVAQQGRESDSPATPAQTAKVEGAFGKERQR
jgi:hypothetical protein